MIAPRQIRRRTEIVGSIRRLSCGRFRILGPGLLRGVPPAEAGTHRAATRAINDCPREGAAVSGAGHPRTTLLEQDAREAGSGTRADPATFSIALGVEQAPGRLRRPTRHRQPIFLGSWGLQGGVSSISSTTPPWAHRHSAAIKQLRTSSQACSTWPAVRAHAAQTQLVPLHRR